LSKISQLYSNLIPSSLSLSILSPININSIFLTAKTNKMPMELFQRLKETGKSRWRFQIFIVNQY
jgi:hypothetical protein